MIAESKTWYRFLHKRGKKFKNLYYVYTSSMHSWWKINKAIINGKRINVKERLQIKSEY